MIDRWPTGTRDTTAFPNIDLSVEPSLRDHLAAFLALDGIPEGDYDQQRDVSGYDVSEQRLRTYRKFYERLGLIYRDEGTIQLSTLGRTIANLESSVDAKLQSLLSDARLLAIDILSRYQFSNPAEDTSDHPPDFDVLPFLATWNAMRQLDDKLHYEELGRVLMRVMRMRDLDHAVQKISHARTTIQDYSTASEEELEALLGATVFENQPEARAASWYSLAGWGGLVIDSRSVNGFRHISSEAISQIDDVLRKPPSFQRFVDLNSWNRYFLGAQVRPRADVGSSSSTALEDLVLTAVQDFSTTGFMVSSGFMRRVVASLLAKRFLILSGHTGSGKTRLGQLFATWISPRESNADYYEVVPVGANWTGADAIFGYPDALDEARYVRTPALDLILRAHQSYQELGPESLPHFLILDEMNLSHVEKYFADFLSAMESGEPISLHGGASLRDGVPPRFHLPPNLYVIGTVNVDETTYMFSPKVLDRAHVIEFRVDRSQIEEFLDNLRAASAENIAGLGADFSAAYVRQSLAELQIPAELEDAFRSEILLFFDVLSSFGNEFALRTVKEIAAFAQSYSQLASGPTEFAEVMDSSVIQKLLPRLHGSLRQVEPILCALGVLCYFHRSVNAESPDRSSLVSKAHVAASLRDPQLHPLAELDGGEPAFRAAEAIYPLSFEKIQRMLQRVVRDGFVSFSEA